MNQGLDAMRCVSFVKTTRNDVITIDMQLMQFDINMIQLVVPRQQNSSDRIYETRTLWLETNHERVGIQSAGLASSVATDVFIEVKTESLCFCCILECLQFVRCCVSEIDPPGGRT